MSDIGNAETDVLIVLRHFEAYETADDFPETQERQRQNPYRLSAASEYQKNSVSVQDNFLKQQDI